MTGVYVHTGGATGEGDPVVLIHGSGNDHTMWRFQTRWLAARGYRVLAPDLPGHGISDGPPCTTIPEWADWLGAFITEWARGPAWVVGHSLGALVSLETAAVHPDKVRGLVLVGAAPRMEVHPELTAAAEGDLERAARFIAGWSYPALFGGGHPEPGTWEQGAMERLVARSQPGALATDLAACVAYDARPGAARVHVPTLLVSGSDDRMARARDAGELAGLIDGSEFVVVPGAGHSVMVQSPRRFNELLAGFLATHGKSPAR